MQGHSFSTLQLDSCSIVTEDCSSGRHGAESVAGSAALAAPRRRPAPATTGSKGSCGEVSSAVRQPHHTSSEDTLSYEPSVSETGDIEPEELPDGQIRVPVVVGTTKGVYLVQVGVLWREQVRVAWIDITVMQWRHRNTRRWSLLRGSSFWLASAEAEGCLDKLVVVISSIDR